MAESCTDFTPHMWKQDICRDCGKTREGHLNVEMVTEIQTPAVLLSTPHQVADDNVHREPSFHSPMDSLTPALLPSCRFGLHCYRTNPHHFAHYSHPPNHERGKLTVDDGTKSPTLAAASRCKNSSREKNKEKKREELQLIKQVEDYVQGLNAELLLKNQEIDKLRQDQARISDSHGTLEKALADELELGERREHEQKRMLAIPLRAPSYWGTNAFQESYREIEILNTSTEFGLINELLTSTITTHNDQYGTIYGNDPTEFIVTQVKRIQNRNLWHEYCFKKVRLCFLAELNYRCEQINKEFF